MSLRTKLASEFTGTAFLLMIVLGSGIMGERLAAGNEAVALLANSIATGAGLFALIQSLGPVSGAHLNPVVTLVESLWGKHPRRELIPYWAAQFAGAIGGVILAHAMFDLPLVQSASKTRSGPPLGISEAIATFGLIGTIALAGRKHVELALSRTRFAASRQGARLSSSRASSSGRYQPGFCSDGWIIRYHRLIKRRAASGSTNRAQELGTKGSSDSFSALCPLAA